MKHVVLSLIALAALIGCSPESEAKVNDAGEKISASADVAQEKAGDALTTGKVRSALNTASDLKIENLDVDTKEGRVYLTGTAPDAESKNRAGQIAKDQVGDDYVVVNELLTK